MAASKVEDIAGKYGMSTSSLFFPFVILKRIYKRKY